MGKVAQIISSATGITRRKAELAERQLKAAKLLAEEKTVTVKEVQEVKTSKTKKDKEEGGE